MRDKEAPTLENPRVEGENSVPKYIKKILKIILLVICAWIAFSVLYYFSLPPVSILKGCFKTSMYQVDLCPKNKNYAPLSSISKYMQYAVIASEDANFYSHEGFDLDEIQDSLEKNWEKKAWRRGGSTITQQLAKNAFLSSRKSLARKLIEAKLTADLEKTFSKKEILEKYLNVVEFGEKLYGIKPAARYYFQKSPSELTYLEASFLAMLLPNPKKYAISFKRRKLTPFARGRIKKILLNMDLSGYISAYQREEAYRNLSYFPWDPGSYPKPIEAETPDTSPPEEENADASDFHLF